MLNVNMLDIDFRASAEDIYVDGDYHTVYLKDGRIANIPLHLYLGLAAFAEAAYKRGCETSVLTVGSGTFYFDGKITLQDYAEINRFIKPIRDAGYTLDSRVCSSDYTKITYCFKTRIKPGEEYIEGFMSEVRVKPLTTGKFEAELVVTEKRTHPEPAAGVQFVKYMQSLQA